MLIRPRVVPSAFDLISRLLIIQNFKLNNKFQPADGNRLTQKIRNVGTVYRKEGTTKYPYKHRHTHAIRREHLMCLLSVCSLNFGRFTLRNNSLNATNKGMRIPHPIQR